MPLFETYDSLCLMLRSWQACWNTGGGCRAYTFSPQSGNPGHDLADYLVAKGIPFREAHSLVGQVVRKSEELHVPLHQLPLKDFIAVNQPSLPMCLTSSILRSLFQNATFPEVPLRCVQEQIVLAKRLAGL